MSDKITIAKINIDENPNTGTDRCSRYSTMLVFKNGEAVATKVGAVSKLQSLSGLKTSIA